MSYEIEKNKEGYYVLNMFDNSILHDSFLESALRCGVSGDERYEKKPEKVRYVKNKNPWNGVTVFTDKMFHAAPHVKSDVKVAWIIEPYDLSPQIYDNIIALEEHFDFIFTYEESLIQRDPDKYKFHPCDTTIIEFESHKMHDKTKLVSMIYSNKTWLFGHRLRHIIAKTLIPDMKYDKIDFFGSATKNPIKFKSEGTNEYMFQIAIENAKRPFYFADKIYDCFVTGTIPIYWGAPNVGDFFDKRGILTFNTPDELKEIMLSLSPEKYKSMLKYAKANFEEVKKYLRPDDLLLESIIENLQGGKNA
tara:strand:- start:12154 stop:13071 length:918 start_codon:yes stop_codon:yes gene_type:complete